jgi:hypothetical protein
MTALSEEMKDKICIYCGNNDGGCTADVPYYCVTIWCKFFVEKGAEPIAKKSKRDYSKRKIMRSLVETF